MAIRRFSSTDSTRIWEHLNRIVDDVTAELGKIPPSAAGQVTFTAAGASAGGTVATVSVTFPQGRFATAPAVFGAVTGTNTNLRKWNVVCTTKSETGATFTVEAISSTTGISNVPMQWYAVATGI